MQQEIQGGQALRVACLQGQWQRQVCQGHAYSMQLCYWLPTNQNRFRHVSLGL
jgi:hypothetical protein